MTNPYIPYIAKGMSLGEIAKHCGTSRLNVFNTLRRDGLPTTPAGYLQLMNKRMLAPSVTRVVGAVA